VELIAMAILTLVFILTGIFFEIRASASGATKLK
jgi:hypothetical protein